MYFLKTPVLASRPDALVSPTPVFDSFESSLHHRYSSRRSRVFVFYHSTSSLPHRIHLHPLTTVHICSLRSGKPRALRGRGEGVRRLAHRAV
jgi:hypothetical protein